jgi:hypothetical protein
MLRRPIVAFCLLFGFASSALACNKPIGPDDFCGTYRAGPKTSFYKINGQLADFEAFANVKDLVQTLPKDQAMRTKYGWSLQAAPKARVTEERLNVEITEGYIVAVKPGEDDRDFHVIVSSSPNRSGATFMNVEVSGLPLNGVDTDEFVRVRGEIQSLLPSGSNQGSGYIMLNPAIKVSIKGSVYFDGDHQAGCQRGCPGPARAKQQTVWEIHPVYSITTQ